MSTSSDMGTNPIPELLIKQAIPSAIGILVLSIYMIIDTIFIGHYVGQLGIAAVTVVMPITFLISAIGMSIGAGGASIIARAFGAKEDEKAQLTFGNQLALLMILVFGFALLGFVFETRLLKLFGANGNIMPFAKDYFRIVLMGTPLLGFVMLANNVLRAEGKPLAAMRAMLIPAILNVILDAVFIVWFDWGIKGAAWATFLGYAGSAGYLLYFIISGKSILKINVKYIKLNWPIIKEISQLGGITLTRNGVGSVLAIILNNSLFQYGGETSVAVYGIVNRLMMFAFFPVFGITQGFLPIAGFNFGAKQAERVRSVIKTALIYGTSLALIIYVGILVFAKPIVKIFTNEITLLEQTPPALICIFLATPVLTLQLIGSAYFQAIGKALPGLLLTLTRQFFFLIPLVLILPIYFGLNGIWMSFPISDMLSALVTAIFFRRGIKKTLNFEDELA